MLSGVIVATGDPAAHQELDAPLALDRIEAEMPGQRGNRGARGFQRRDHIALDRAPEAGDVDQFLRHSGAQAEVPHQGRQRHRAQPPGQPVPEPPVRAIGPDIGQFGKERIGPGIPGPGGAFGDMRPCGCRRPRTSGCSPHAPQNR